MNTFELSIKISIVTVPTSKGIVFITSVDGTIRGQESGSISLLTSFAKILGLQMLPTVPVSLSIPPWYLVGPGGPGNPGCPGGPGGPLSPLIPLIWVKNRNKYNILSPLSVCSRTTLIHNSVEGVGQGPPKTGMFFSYPLGTNYAYF